ncbi:hypothetical protein BC749_102895 [Flavobacterium araucananum]|uniref:WD40 repeat domain-containing protein n=1 Tax=Flavobacterium araucananum TaxID=946678 RepID=A0A227PBJ3_9FLAO|nr:hypothetical protein [Flavobacterium araucananum]OXG07142.1 hypothetical protein B0A64_10040 [Flavobacterium araucananum]PWK01319.1 hypothetical protein BC749_102895 [Flavobacterium araucananum]
MKKLQEASERWKKEGHEYKTALNEWLDIIYIQKENPTTDCPEEPRKDMSEYVLEQLIEHNKNGQHKEFRELFPADNDPLSDVLDDSKWYKVRKVAILDDNRIIAKIGDYYEWQGVYTIQDDKITLLDDLIGFGFSEDKKYFAKVYNTKIEIHEGWDGAIVSTLDLPENATLKQLQYESINVFSTGKQVVLTTYCGIFVINEDGFELIHGGLDTDYEDDEDEDEDDEDENDDEDDEDDEESKYKFLYYPHAALSPDDKYITVGSQNSSHIVLMQQDQKWEETANIEQRSSYPNIACFNYKFQPPLLALGSCHFSHSATLGVLVDQIEGLKASGYDMDSEALFVVDNRRWIFSMYPSASGFYLGSNDGYLWLKVSDEKSHYIHIGGTIMSIDVAPDRQHIVVGTASGQVVLLRWQNTDPVENKNIRIDPYLITNLPVIDEKRYLFMNGNEPLIW